MNPLLYSDEFLGGDIFQGLSSKLVMEDPEDANFDSFFADAPYLHSNCIDPDCPPPLFALPPPPRPPWIEEGCPENSPLESCDNIIIIDSQVHLQETFQNLIIIAVCSALLVIMLVFSVACIWRLRNSRANACRCGDSKQDGDGQGLELSDNIQLKSSSEVYDNPNYSHIMIGGQPFFILPSGELSEHVPVPSSGELLTPRKTEPQHIYEGGSSTYRSTSDYDTDSSTYRPDSDRASNGFPPIYEEIDNCSTMRSFNRDSELESQFQGSKNGEQNCAGKCVSPVNTMAVIQRDDCLPQTVLHNDKRIQNNLQKDERLLHPWSTHKSLSPRRPASRIPNRPSNNSSVYYYSDTLRRKGIPEIDSGRESVQESDSGISSRSGHNTSSESTPQPHGEFGRSSRRGRNQPVVSSQEDFSQDSPVKFPNIVDTQVVVRNTTKREPIVKL